MSDLVICPNCKGKGHVLDGCGAIVATLSIWLLPCIVFDRNDPDGLTREECSRCGGDGFIQRKKRSR